MPYRHPPSCPKCGSHHVVPIVYGYPAPETAHRAGAGEIRLGGCCVTGHDPNWHCEDCDYAWGDDTGGVP